VRLAQNDDVIQTLPANTANEAFTRRVDCARLAVVLVDLTGLVHHVDSYSSVHQWRLHSGLQDADASAPGDPVEVGSEPECTQSTQWTRSTEAHGPSEARERRRRSEPDIVDLHEVDRPHDVVRQERPPALTVAGRTYGQEMSLDGRFAARMPRFSSSPRMRKRSATNPLTIGAGRSVSRTAVAARVAAA